MQYNEHMAYSIRIQPEGERAIDEIVQMGNFPNRAEAVRTALNLLYTVLLDEQRGLEFVALPQEKVDSLGIARGISKRPIR